MEKKQTKKNAHQALVHCEKMPQKVKYANPYCSLIGCWVCWRGHSLSTSWAWRLLQAGLCAESVKEACSVYRAERQPLVSRPAAEWKPVRPTLTLHTAQGRRLTVSLGKHTAGCGAAQQLVQATPEEPSHSSLQWFWWWSIRTSQGFSTGLNGLETVKGSLP